jgi:integrase
MKLTDKTIIHLTKPGRYSDGAVQGLHLWVKSPGKKYWILRFTYQAKRHDHSLGPYPGLSLSDARIKAVQLNGELNHHITPFEIKKRETNLVKTQEKEIPLFKDYAIQCIDAKRPTWRNLKHGDQWLNSLKDYAFPFIGNKKIDEITTEDILKILDPIWNTKTTTASRLRGRLEWILGSATTRGLRQGMNPAIWRGHLNTVLGEPNKVSKPRHHSALPFGELPQFIFELTQMNCLSALALEFTILTATRTSETLGAKRNEIQGDVWIIPAERMKCEKEHRIPLIPRALEIIALARQKNPESEYLFSIKRSRVSNMLMLKLVKDIGLKITVHGFRSTFRDWVSEVTDYSSELAEMALAHVIKNKVEAAYRRGDLFERRKNLMRDWCNFCHSYNKIQEMKAA